MIQIVTGTDTDVGKTVVTAALAAVHRAAGRRVAVVKPAQTGVAPDEPGDLAEVVRLAGPVETVEPVRLRDPLAPDTAARITGVTLPTREEQVATVRRVARDHDVVLVEGAGGILVRVGEDFTLLDLAASLAGGDGDVEVIVVARAGLGTLNHAALTVEAVTARDVPVRGLVIGSWPAEPGLAERHNREDLPRITGAPLLGAVPAGAPSLDPAAFRAAAAEWLPHLP